MNVGGDGVQRASERRPVAGQSVAGQSVAGAMRTTGAAASLALPRASDAGVPSSVAARAERVPAAASGAGASASGGSFGGGAPSWSLAPAMGSRGSMTALGGGGRDGSIASSVTMTGRSGGRASAGGAFSGESNGTAARGGAATMSGGGRGSGASGASGAGPVRRASLVRPSSALGSSPIRRRVTVPSVPSLHLHADEDAREPGARPGSSVAPAAFTSNGTAAGAPVGRSGGVGGSDATGGITAAGIPRSAAGNSGGARRASGRLPVSGVGAIAGAANAVAGEIARSVADDITRSSGGSARGGSGGDTVTRWFDGSSGGDEGTLRRAESDEGGSHGGSRSGDRDSDSSPEQEEKKRDEWLKFMTTDAFRDQLLEMLQERLLGELERRGGRQGGWFA